jgi:two-component system alkaline phosphatase synthesis response regulator PhoP
MVISHETELFRRLGSGLENQGFEVWFAATLAEAIQIPIRMALRHAAVIQKNGGNGSAQVMDANGMHASPQVLTPVIEEVPIQMGKLPGLLLVSVNHPDGTPAKIGKETRKALFAEDLPVWVWSSHEQEELAVRLLEEGADDWLPTLNPEFAASKLRSFFRREERRPFSFLGDTPHVLRRGLLTVDLERHIVEVNGRRVDLTKTEFMLLWQLMRTPGRTFTRAQLLDICGGESSVSIDRTIDVHIHSLRKKLGPCGWLVETVRGIGYRAKEDAA